MPWFSDHQINRSTDHPISKRYPPPIPQLGFQRIYISPVPRSSQIRIESTHVALFGIGFQGFPITRFPDHRITRSQGVPLPWYPTASQPIPFWPGFERFCLSDLGCSPRLSVSAVSLWFFRSRAMTAIPSPSPGSSQIGVDFRGCHPRPSQLA